MRTCPSCGGVIGRDCFNPVECAHISNSIQEDHINRLEALAKAEKHFTELSKEEQEKEIQFELKESAIYLGGWDKLREFIDQLEQSDNEAAAERAQNGDAWSGGFAENH